MRKDLDPNAKMSMSIMLMLLIKTLLSFLSPKKMKSSPNLTLKLSKKKMKKSKIVFKISSTK
ncbi:MAG: hypothetical protein ACKO96_18995, partial [Flammeovirgaceae bacterium]